MDRVLNITLMRHGQALGGDVYRGCTDDKLTELGVKQMYQASDLLLNPIDKIVSSPLLRCAEFSQAYSDKKKIKADYVSDFQEINFGQWETQSYDQINKKYPTQLKQYYQNPYSYTPPDAESMQEFESRVMSGWGNLLEDSRSNNHVLLVTHGGVIRMLVHKMLDMSFTQTFNISIGHGCLLGFKIYQGESNFVQLESLLGIGVNKAMAVQFMHNNIKSKQ